MMPMAQTRSSRLIGVYLKKQIILYITLYVVENEWVVGEQPGKDLTKKPLYDYVVLYTYVVLYSKSFQRKFIYLQGTLCILYVGFSKRQFLANNTTQVQHTSKKGYNRALTRRGAHHFSRCERDRRIPCRFNGHKPLTFKALA